MEVELRGAFNQARFEKLGKMRRGFWKILGNCWKNHMIR